MLERILRVYQASDGDATRKLYDELNKLGPVGTVAVNLFRACKNSERAKEYRSSRARRAAYGTKNWAMDNLCHVLAENADALGISWGWGVDLNTKGFENVLYVDIATGQVSFHTSVRGAGPNFPGQWDGRRGVSTGRICQWCAHLLARTEMRQRNAEQLGRNADRAAEAYQREIDAMAYKIQGELWPTS